MAPSWRDVVVASLTVGGDGWDDVERRVVLALSVRGQTSRRAGV